MQPKKLKRIHKVWLSKQGLRSKDYLFIKEDAESYIFWNKKKDKEEVFRR